MIEVELANRQSAWPVDGEPLIRAARSVLEGEGLAHGSLSLAVVDDAAMQALNLAYLGHDYPTDVLSFPLNPGPAGWSGEIVVSVETAAASAPRFESDVQRELLLYVVHGTLHLVGYDDANPPSRRRMRAKERYYLRRLGALGGAERGSRSASHRLRVTPPSADSCDAD